MANTADVIIIGAGVHGASLAFHLARRGVKALVLEKKLRGRRRHRPVKWAWFACTTTCGRIPNWPGSRSSISVTGRKWSAEIADSRARAFFNWWRAADKETLKANVAIHQDIGVPVMLIGADDVKRLAPTFATEDIEVAAYEPESGYAMPSDTAAALMNAAREKGARLIQDCAVTGVILSAGKVAGVQTTQGDFSAPLVVNAAGPWAGKVNQMVGLDLPYDTWRHDTMFVVRPRQIGPGHPAVIDDANDMYFRPEGSLTLVGLEDGNPIGESPDGDTDHAEKGFVERGIDRICRRIPIMENGGLHSAHGGYDGITPDQHPMLGPAGPDGFYLDCGFSGTGFKISPAVGLCMSELILDGKAKTVDLSIFAPQRFAEAHLIVGQYPYRSIWH